MVRFRKSLHSLAGKLILTVGILMTTGSIIFGYLFINFEKKVMMKNLVNYASSSADLVKRGIHYGMLTSRRDIIQQNVEVAGMGKNVLFIRVFNPSGTIVYSSKSDEIGNTTLSPGEFETLSQTSTISEPMDISGRQTLRFTMPVYNEPQCYTSTCHAHLEDQQTLAVVEAGFSIAEVDYLIRQNRLATLILGGLFVLVISVFLCIILYKFVSKPVAFLEEGMKRISKGDLDTPININTRDEMGLLASTFNSMAQDLKRYRQDMEHWTHMLEDEVKKKTAEIMQAQEELINAEKLASLGRMAAGVAHELNSPLTGVITFAHLLKNRTPSEDAQAHEDLQVVIDQANRCSKIIKGLLGFSRRAAFEQIEMNLNDLLDATVSMVRNQSRFHNVRFDIKLAPSVPPVMADPNQMQQVFLNMLMNATDAMNEKGAINIATRTLPENGNSFVEVEFTDTGPGIAEEHLGKLFEPFFTTKPVGKGTGLGLSVSYGIIKRHGGDITVKNVPGQGASFTIRLPAHKR